MNPYQVGRTLAVMKLTKTAETYPAEYEAAGNVGALSGGALGAAGGAALGNWAAKELGRQTRQKHLLIPIPGTGIGESIFNYSKGPVVGQALGALAGGALGAGIGHNAGHLSSLYRGAPPHKLVNEGGQVDPNLLAYLSEGY